MSESSIGYRTGPVTEIWLNRPAMRNALNTPMIEELSGLLKEVGRDRAIDVVILTAAGDRAFCAGADLSEVERLRTLDERRDYFSGMASLVEALRNLPQPVIGAVFGYTLAGGMGLAAGVDLLVAAEDTHFGLPEVKIGLYPMVVTAPIARLIGLRRTLELALTGRMIDVRTAEAWGFVNQVVPMADLLTSARKWAEEIRAGSPLIARLGKEGSRLQQDMAFPEALEYLKNMVSMVAGTRDSQEGVRAFREKRNPVWPSGTK